MMSGEGGKIVTIGVGHTKTSHNHAIFRLEAILPSTLGYTL